MKFPLLFFCFLLVLFHLSACGFSDSSFYLDINCVNVKVKRGVESFFDLSLETGKKNLQFHSDCRMNLKHCFKLKSNR